MKHLYLLSFFVLGLVGCATTSSVSSQQCLDARRTVDRFTIVSPSELKVQSGARWYRVVLENCDISNADRIGFSNGPERMVWYGSRPVFAAQLYSGQICGRAGDMVVWRRHFEDFRFPGQMCRVRTVERID